MLPSEIPLIGDHAKFRNGVGMVLRSDMSKVEGFEAGSPRSRTKASFAARRSGLIG